MKLSNLCFEIKIYVIRIVDARRHYAWQLVAASAVAEMASTLVLFAMRPHV